MEIKFILLLLGIAIPTIGEFKEELRTKSARYISIGLVVTAGVLQYRSDRETDKEHLSQFNQTIEAGASTIKKLSAAYDSIQSIQGKLTEAVDTQQKINKNSQVLLVKNDRLAKRLSYVSGNIDKIAYPLFPMTVTILASLPLTDANDSLKKYVYELKKGYESDKSLKIKNISVRVRPNGTVRDIDIEDADKTLNGRILEDFDSYTQFKFAVFRPEGGTLKKLSHITPQMDFILGADKSDFRETQKILIATFGPVDTLKILVGYEDHIFRNTNLSDDLYSTNAIIPGHQLAGCYLAATGKATIKAMIIGANSGLQTPISIFFNSSTNQLTNMQLQYIFKKDFISPLKAEAVIAKLSSER